VASHPISYSHALADTIPHPDLSTAGAHAHTYPTAISLYFTYFDTHASGISVTICSGKRITRDRRATDELQCQDPAS
jgi:hypothetical protein